MLRRFGFASHIGYNKLDGFAASFLSFGRHTSLGYNTAAIFLTAASLSENDLSRFVVIIVGLQT